MEVFVSLIIGMVSAAFGVIATWWWKKISSRGPYTKVLGITAGESTVIVIPHRLFPGGVVPPNLGHTVHVTYEDMLAANYGERALTLAGFKDKLIEIRSEQQFKDDDAYKHKNIILICSSRANDLTKQALKLLNKVQDGVNGKFEQYQDKPERWKLMFQGGEYFSRSYDEEAKLLQDGGRPEDGRRHDYGLLVRVRNPWDDSKKLIILAGIRGFGTWGVARCLRERPQEILKKSKGRDFACVVEVTYDNNKITSYDINNNFFVVNE